MSMTVAGCVATARQCCTSVSATRLRTPTQNSTVRVCNPVSGSRISLVIGRGTGMFETGEAGAHTLPPPPRARASVCDETAHPAITVTPTPKEAVWVVASAADAD